MDIVAETQNMINKKIAALQSLESAWREKQGGQLQGWQTARLREGIGEVNLYKHLLIEIFRLRKTDTDRKEELLCEIMNKSWYQKLTIPRDYRDTILDDLENSFTALEAKYKGSANKFKALYWTVIVHSGLPYNMKKYRELKAQYQK